MPTYSYRCADCGHAFDIHQSFSDDALTVCPSCGGTLRKQYDSIGVTFNGSGFYRTDSRAETKAGSGGSGASDGGSGSSGSSGSSGGSGESGGSTGSSGSGSGGSGGGSGSGGASGGSSSSGSSGSGSSGSGVSPAPATKSA